MSNKVFLATFLFTLIFLVNCDKDKDYPDTPAITMSDKQVYDNPAKIIIDFTDGDGDIGLNEGDTLPPYEYNVDPFNEYYYNLLLYYYEKNDSIWEEVELPVPYFYRIPVITPRGQNKALNGEIDVDVSLPFNRPDSIRFEIILIDQALRESNRLQTPVIYR